MGKCGCKFVVNAKRRLSRTKQKEIGSFSFDGSGWSKAYDLAKKYSREFGDQELTVRISCDSGHINQANCIEGDCWILPAHQGSRGRSIANLGRRPGSKKRKKARAKRKIAKANQTPQQKKFAKAASKCKGKPGYRECVSYELKR